jgi:hypothetical protein
MVIPSALAITIRDPIDGEALPLSTRLSMDTLNFVLSART